HRQNVRQHRPEVVILGEFDTPALDEQTEVGGPRSKSMRPEEEMYAALVLGLRDYVEKNHFEQVVIGVSGGIDSALTALIAVDALGAEGVSCAVMPSAHSSRETQEDARAIADNLGVERFDLPLDDLMDAFEET